MNNNNLDYFKQAIDRCLQNTNPTSWIANVEIYDDNLYALLQQQQIEVLTLYLKLALQKHTAKEISEVWWCYALTKVAFVELGCTVLGANWMEHIKTGLTFYYEGTSHLPEQTRLQNLREAVQLPCTAPMELPALLAA